MPRIIHLHALIFICFLNSIAYAQTHKQNDQWVFGFQSQIGFNSSINSGTIQFYSIEACASVSDPLTGELLFYSNGEMIMDKNGNLMQNGNGLKGSVTSTQGALILPFPKKDSLYILFTTPAMNALDKFVYYSVIDMRLNNGLGGVVDQLKNIPLEDEVTEGMTYTYNADSTGYWLLIHKRQSNDFVSLLIDKDGIGKVKTTSSVGRKLGNNSTDYLYFMTYLKISPDGRYVAMSNVPNTATYKGQVDVFKLDPCSGRLTAFCLISELPFNCYGNAFSSNSQFLYITSLEFPSRVFQVNLSAGNDVQINSSMNVVYTAPRAPASQNRIYYLGGLQLRSDNKIYITEAGQEFLHCIENPNVYGPLCNVAEQKVKLRSGTRSFYGLPQLVPSQVNAARLIKSDLEIVLSDSCVEFLSAASFKGLDNPQFVRWYLIDLVLNDTITLNDSLVFRLPQLKLQSYKLELLIRKDCKNYMASIVFKVENCECPANIILSDSCIGKPIRVRVESKKNFKILNWVLTDADGNIIYTGNDRFIDLNFQSDVWLNIEVIIELPCGLDTLKSLVHITTCPDCNWIYIPNAFSPNTDGKNDVISFKGICEFESFDLQIFNRWGEKVFQSNDVSVLWDGTYKEEQVQQGYYIYILTYRTKGQAFKTQSGDLYILN